METFIRLWIVIFICLSGVVMLVLRYVDDEIFIQLVVAQTFLCGDCVSVSYPGRVKPYHGNLGRA